MSSLREPDYLELALVGWMAVAGGCVDASASGPSPSSCGAPAASITLIGTDPVPAEFSADAPTGPYRWQNVAIKGGGFVTGIVFSRAVANLVYARTDVGGAYRFDLTDNRWVPLSHWVGQADANLMGIESIAADPVDPAQVYLAAGTYLGAGNGYILHSTNYGQDFTRNTIPVPMGGNQDGRSMGERLAIDPNLPSTLYFGSRTQGLWVSRDSSATWQRTSFPVTGDQNQGLSFVLFDGASGTPGAATPTLYVGVATVAAGADTLYRSLDAGSSWAPVPDAPKGMMPHHAAFGPDRILYLVYNNGPGPNGITAGAVWKFDPVKATWTPCTGAGATGFGGLSVDAQRPGTVMVSTIDVWSPDHIYRTTDGGKTWRETAALRDPAGAPWLYFGGSSLNGTGWMGDLEIDPFNASRVLHTTGQGIWWTDDVTNADVCAPTHWSFRDDGLEETVPLDLVSPPEGAHLLSGVGDLAGFRHDDFAQSPPGGMYTPTFKNVRSLDFAELAPNIVARVGVYGTTDGRVPGAYSTDGGSSWTLFATQPAKQGGDGSIAVSADGNTFVWSPRNTPPAYTRDRGQTWTTVAGITTGARMAADRVNPNKFYAATDTAVYVSSDGGASFSPSTLTPVPSGARPRAVFGIEGDVWLVAKSGLWHSTDSGGTFAQVPQVTTAPGAQALGFGQAPPGQSYPALYLWGMVNGAAGVFRSDDGGQSFERIDDAPHQFGYASVITGDPRIYGRVYLGTGGFGIIYGDPV